MEKELIGGVGIMRWEDFFFDYDSDGSVSFEERVIGESLFMERLRQPEDEYDAFDDDEDDLYGCGEGEENDLFDCDEEDEEDEDVDLFGYDDEEDEDDPYGYDEEDNEEDEDELVYDSARKVERDLSPIVFGSERQKNLPIEDFVCRAMIACIGRPEEDKNAPGGSVDKPDPLIMLGLAYYEFIELSAEERCRRLRDCGFDPADYPNYCV